MPREPTSTECQGVCYIAYAAQAMLHSDYPPILALANAISYLSKRSSHYASRSLDTRSFCPFYSTTCV